MVVLTTCLRLGFLIPFGGYLIIKLCCVGADVRAGVGADVCAGAGADTGVGTGSGVVPGVGTIAGVVAGVGAGVGADGGVIIAPIRLLVSSFSSSSLFAY